MMILIVFTVMGCSNSAIETEVHSTENPDAKEILTINPEADIFQFEGVIYQTGIEWVDALTLTKGEKVGEIKKRNQTGTNFEDEMANKLPVGVEIYSTHEQEGPILLVELDGEILKYYALVEG